MRRRQHGQALLEAAARRRGGWVGLQATTPSGLAQSLVEPELGEQETPLPDGLGPVLAGEALRRCPPEQRAPLEGEAGHALSVPLARTFDELRLQGIAPATYRRFQADGSPRQRAKAEAYAAYVELLREGHYVDAAATFRRATDLVQSRGERGSRVFAVLDAVELPALAFEFLNAVRTNLRAEAGSAFYRIGSTDGQTDRAETAPPNSAAVLFEDAPRPDASARQDNGPPDERHGAEPPTFWTAVGAETEVEAVFQEILQSETPYDDTEIAYADPDAYRTVVETVAERHDVPVTLSAGRPVGATSVGQALQGYLEWISGGLAAETLIRLLRGGLLWTDRVLADTRLPPARAATLLAEQRYAPGPQGYFDALRRKRDRVQQKQEGTTPASRKARREVDALTTVVKDLMALVPDSDVAVASLAGHAAQFIERFGPIDKPPESLSQDERTPAQAARGRLLDALEALGEAPISAPIPRAQAVKQLQRLTDEMFVKASAPKPGHVHVVPLEAAGYAGRPHLFAVGLDGESTSATAAEDPLLTDAERRRLEEQSAHPLQQARTAGDRKSWHLNRGLQRHAGPLLLSTRTYDVAEGEEVAPSPLYLQLRERALARQNAEGDAPDVMDHLADRHVTLLPEPTLPLLGREQAWRAAETTRRSGAADGSLPVMEGGMEALHPWIADGRHAERQRQSDTYTTFDGILADDTHPRLDILGADYDDTLSASRLETLAASPYAYFLKYILDVRPLEEPALDDVLWIDRRTQGSVLHKTFRGFMASLRGRGASPAPEHEPLLMDELEEQLDEVREQIEPPSEAVARATQRRLAQDARVFLRSEARYEHAPAHFEFGFGFGRSSPRNSGYGPATIDLGDGVEFELRGQIDRIDRTDSGELVLWDYKTGSKSPYEGDDAPLQKGENLQWALYAFAVEDLLDTRVHTSGYFFTSTKELGDRIAHDPRPYQSAIAALLRRLSDMARAGCFPMNLDTPPWMFGDYEQIVPDTDRRGDELDQKLYPEARPTPPHLDD